MSRTTASLNARFATAEPVPIGLTPAPIDSDSQNSDSEPGAGPGPASRSERPWGDDSLPARARDAHAPVAALDPSDVAAIEDFRRVLETRGYSEAGLRAALREGEGRLSLRVDLPLYRKRLSARQPLNTLVKLFCLHLRVEADEAREALAPLTLAQLLALGLVEIVARGVRARVAISPCENLWLAHDFADAPEGLLAPDHVLGISPATLTLARLTLRRRAGLVLDLGAGCGVQGLLAASRCDGVIAVDTNPRALNFTAFNARLNRLSNVQCRQGSLFDPVPDQRFDLIICNPPYVISPESHYQFRDSGLPGDRICEQVIRTAPAYLNEGGLACVLCNWAHPNSEPWSQRLQQWVSDSGCDAVLLHGGAQDPASYAAAWTRTSDLAAYEETFNRWCRYYERMGIETLSAGAVILRRRAAPQHWTRAESLPKNLSDSCADQIESIFQAEDFLGAHPADADLLGQNFVLADGVRLDQALVSHGGRLTLESIRLECRRGLRFQGLVDASTTQLLARCDGHHPFGQAVDALAQASEGDPGAARSRAAGLARQLVALGFLVPVEGAGAAESTSPGGERGPAAQSNPALGSLPSHSTEGSL